MGFLCFSLHLLYKGTGACAQGLTPRSAGYVLNRKNWASADAELHNFLSVWYAFRPNEWQVFSPWVYFSLVYDEYNKQTYFYLIYNNVFVLSLLSTASHKIFQWMLNIQNTRFGFLQFILLYPNTYSYHITKTC